MIELENRSILYVLPRKGFSDHELNQSSRVLQNKGVNISIVSVDREPVESSDNVMILTDKSFEEVQLKDFDAAIFIGQFDGEDNEKAQELARKFSEEGKIMGAISVSVELLADAGVLKDREITAHPKIIPELKGEHEVNAQAVVRDKNLITSNVGENAEIFGEKISEALEEME